MSLSVITAGFSAHSTTFSTLPGHMLQDDVNSFKSLFYKY